MQYDCAYVAFLDSDILSVKIGEEIVFLGEKLWETGGMKTCMICQSTLGLDIHHLFTICSLYILFCNFICYKDQSKTNKNNNENNKCSHYDDISSSYMY